MFHTATRLVGNAEDAEDVTQEAFIRVFQGLEQFKAESTLGAWIKRIVVNTALNSKYSDLKVGRVQKGLKIIYYDDEIDIDRLEGELESIYFEGKYTNLDLNLASSLSYRIKATITYGNLKFDESEYDISLYKEKSDKIELKAKTKGASAQSPLVELAAFDCNIRL